MASKSEVEKLAEQKVSLVDYFNKYVVGVKKGVTVLGVGQATICPLHTETDASFHIYEKGGHLLYKCFGCGAGGNVVMLHRAVQKLYGGKDLTRDASAIELLKMYGYEDIAQESVAEVNPIQEALNKVRGYSKINLNPTFNFILYKSNNDKIKSMDIPVRSKASQFGSLDRMLSAYLMDSGNGT